MATHCTHIQVIIIIIILRMRSACAEALQTYIYIYTHRESLVRNHEPCAKALGNYKLTRYTHQRRCLAQIATKGSCMPNLRGIPGKPWRPIASSSNNYYLAHAQRMRRSVTDIFIYIYTHRESLVRNHEPCAKALGNYRRASIISIRRLKFISGSRGRSYNIYAVDDEKILKAVALLLAFGQ